MFFFFCCCLFCVKWNLWWCTYTTVHTSYDNHWIFFLFFHFISFYEWPGVINASVNEFKHTFMLKWAIKYYSFFSSLLLLFAAQLRSDKDHAKSRAHLDTANKLIERHARHETMIIFVLCFLYCVEWVYILLGFSFFSCVYIICCCCWLLHSASSLTLCTHFTSEELKNIHSLNLLKLL